ncbi:MAG TPA: tetratricopeptide repeat protein, partial [Pirellulaceae bacterium]
MQDDEDRHLAVWDTTSRLLLTTLEVDRLDDVSFSDDMHELTLFHRRGFSRLPLQCRADGSCQLGPPDSDRLFGITSHFYGGSAVSADGLTAACITEGKLLVKTWPSHPRPTLDSSESGQPLRTHSASRTTTHQLPADHDKVAVSPDGRWVVTSGWHALVTSIWDVRRGDLLQELPLERQVHVVFTPDSAQMVTCLPGAYHFRDLPSMKVGLTLPRTDCQHPAPIAFSQDGSLAVCCLRPGGLDVVQLPAGRVLFRLQRPNQSPPRCLAISPDKTLVLETTDYQQSDGQAVVWDLVKLDQELKEVGLDLKDVNLSDRPPTSDAVAALEFTGCDELHVPRFMGEMSDVEARRELERLEAVYSADPRSADHANDLAWNLLTAPPSLRDPARALELAEMAVKESPDSLHRNTLAVACYRLGQFDRAIELLEQNLRESSDEELTWDYLFLAMSHSAKGQSSQAQSYLRRAEEWMSMEQDGKPVIDRSMMPELQALLREARETVLAKSS